MKKYLLLFTLLVLFSCSTTQTIIDPISKKEVKVFENEDFSFYYPMSWIRLNKEEKAIFVSPKKAIRVINKAKSKLVFKQGETVKNTSRTYGHLNQRISSNKVIFIKFSIGEKSFGDYIKACETRSKTNNNKEKVFELNSIYDKQSENHYIEQVTIRAKKNGIRIPSINIIKHYIKKGTDIYQIQIMFEAEKEKDYLKDALFILNSFKFYDGSKIK